MPTTRKSAPIQEVSVSFEIENYSDKVHRSTYYFLRDKIAFQVKRQLEEQFHWETYLTEFEENFGTPNEYKISLEQMLAFAEQKFGADRDKIMQFSRESYQRRQERKIAELS
jgi:hypothetical protein